MRILAYFSMFATFATFLLGFVPALFAAPRVVIVEHYTNYR